MRLSSFPDAYHLTGLMGAQREQVGKAVPPLMAFHVARAIREHQT
jgi:site-specific DNA-cytosine methylase